jgi:hypothetical protein
MLPTIEEMDDEEDFDQTLGETEPSWIPRLTHSIRIGVIRTDLDSHADATVLSEHCVIVHMTNHGADVLPFLPKLETAEKVQIITGPVAYDPPGDETICFVNQVLYVPALRDNLLCYNQCQMNDVVVNTCPKSLSENPTDNAHTLRF